MNCKMCNGELADPTLHFPNFPMYPSSVKPGALLDEHGAPHTYTFALSHCKECSLIQQMHLPDLNIVYAFEKNEGVGKKWDRHYDAFTDFVKDNSNSELSCLEIGGGNCRVAQRLYDSHYKRLTICDVNSQIPKHFKSKQGFFEDLSFDETYDVIYLSHVFEHISDFEKHLQKAKSLLKPGGKYMLSLPNFEHWITNHYLNAFIQEHITYPFKHQIIQVLEKHGLSYDCTNTFEDHSLFLCFKNTPMAHSHSKVSQPENQAITALTSYRDYLSRLNTYLESALSHRPKHIYLFGAHIFAQILLSMDALKKHCVTGILDNSILKQNKELYLFNLPVHAPSILTDVDAEDTAIIVFAGSYEDEICQQLLGINSQLTLINSNHFRESQMTMEKDLCLV